MDAVDGTGERPGAVAVIGRFDSGSLDAQVRRQVVVGELTRRRPDLDVRAFAPFGGEDWPSPVHTEPVEPLGDPRVRRADLAAEIGLAVVTVDAAELDDLDDRTRSRLLAAPGPRTTVAWHAIGLHTDRDADAVAAHAAAAAHASFTGARVELAARLGTARAVAVPHPARLAPRAFAPWLLDNRREFLRAVDAWPRHDRPIVVQGSASDLDAVERIAGTDHATAIVAIGTGTDPGADDFARTLVNRLPEARSLPDHAGVEEHVAAIACAAGVVASAPIVLELAAAFGVPACRLDSWRAEPAPKPLRDLLTPTNPDAGAVAALDADLDTIAALAPGHAPGPLAWARLAALDAALDARGRRLAAERSAMADAVAAERARVAPLEARIADLETDNRALRNLEVVRWRMALGRVRSRLRRRPR
jgi:hypothetical protein